MTQIWTVLAETSSTGEGLTYYGWIGYASSHHNALVQFENHFGPFAAMHATDNQPGVTNNPLIRLIFSDFVLKKAKQAEQTQEFLFETASLVHVS